MLETSNAWEPGDESAAEQSFEIWCAQEEGLTESEMPILYDAVIAPPNTSLSDDPGPGEISLTEGLEWVYQDCPWVLKNLSAIKEDVWRTPDQASARRFYLKSAFLSIYSCRIQKTPLKLNAKNKFKGEVCINRSEEHTSELQSHA